MDPVTPRRRTWAKAALLALLAAGAFAGSVPGGFVFDDESAIVENPVVNGAAPLYEAFSRDFWGRPAERTIGSYRPVALLSLALDGRIGGLSPRVFHLGNVAWHALATVLLFWAWRGLAGEGGALAAAALFAVLAAPAEAVQGIVGRADLMLAAFATAGLAAHRRPGRGSGVAAAACLALALGSKESAVAVPLAWASADLLAPVAGAPRRRGRWYAYGAVLATYLAARVAVLGALQAHGVEGISNPLSEAPLAGRLLGACRVLAERYGAGLLDPTRRLYDCSANACGPAGAGDPLAWVGALVVLLVALAPLLLRRRSPVAAAGLAWFGWVFLPASNLLLLGPTIYGERLLYAPAMGLCVAAAAGAEALGRRAGRTALGWALAGIVGVANLFAVQVRNLDWRTPDALYASGLEQAADSVKVQYNAAWAAFRRGALADAETHAREAAALRPDHPDARALLAAVLDLQGRPAEAEAEFQGAMARGRTPDLAVHHGTFLARRGRLDEALAEVRAARTDDPDHARLADLERRLLERIAARGGGPAR
jgi:protein O-mannosyl-transferase